MKKGTIVALIVAAVLLLAGGIILVLGLSFAGSMVDPVTMVTESEHTIPENFDSILIDTADCDVNFVFTNDTADPKVVVREREDVQHSVAVEDGVLKIKMQDNRTWKNFIGVYWEEMEMTVYLPQAQYESLRVTTDTGDIRIPQVLEAVAEMVLRSSTGEISCIGVSGDMLDCMTSTGDITVQSGTPTIMKLHSSTGDLKVSVVGCDEIHLKTSTGEVSAENVRAQMFTCNSSTGEVELEDVQAEDYLQVFTDTGDIDIENADAPTVNIQTDTGDVKVPAAWQLQRIESGTGDIHFE